MNLQKQAPVRVKKIRKSANGQDCTVNSPFCNYNSETTVFAHYSVAGESGVGLKNSDESGMYACYDCHVAIDQHKMSEMDELFYCFRACRRTWRLLIQNGVLK